MKKRAGESVGTQNFRSIWALTPPEEMKKMGEHAKTHYLDVDFEVARSIHRVVRAMHDGECPRCHNLFSSVSMRGRDKPADHVCPRCGFTITKEESEAAIAAFAPVMQRNLEVFEQWRASRARITND